MKYNISGLIFLLNDCIIISMGYKCSILYTVNNVYIVKQKKNGVGIIKILKVFKCL